MRKMKKVVFQINDASISGGAERVVISWVNYLSDKYNNLNVELLTSVNSKAFYKINNNVKINTLNIQIDERNYIQPKNKLEKLKLIVKDISLTRLRKLLKYFKNFDENDVIILNKFELVRPLWVLKKVRLLKRFNIVYFYHGCSETYLKSLSNLNRKFIFETADKVVFLFDNKISNLKNVKSEKIRVIQNPLPFRSNQVCDLKSKSILCVGRLSEEKGIDLLLDAWAKISNQYDWKLIIVGDGNERVSLQKKCDQLGITSKVSFEGQQDEVKKYYLKSSIYAMTSKTEGMPMVLLEAMECGMPIIAFEIPATKNLIAGTGILVNNFSIAEFSNSLKKLIEDYELRYKLSLNSKIKAKEFYIEKIVEELEKVLEIQ